MIKYGRLFVTALGLAVAACSSTDPGHPGTAGSTGTAGTGGATAGTTGTAGATATGGATGTAGAAATAGAGGGGGTSGSAGAGGTAGTTAAGGTGGGGVGGPTDGGATPDASVDGSAAGMTGTSDAGPGPSFLPAGYTGTPFAALKIPGRINAADYDRGGAGVAWCHNTGACGSGTTTGDWYPGGSSPYRPPIPANAQICSGAACADNVGVCRMSPNKPDKIDPTTLAPASDTYLCYSVAGEWTKYTVVVAQAGTYSVGGFMAVPQGGAMNISFAPNITTGNLTLVAVNPNDRCGGGEYYHCWWQRDNLATVTFPAAGTYLMTLTQVGRFNADNFTFTKM